VALQVIARSWTPSPLSTDPTTPSILSVLRAAINNPIDSAARGNATAFQTAIEELRRNGQRRTLLPEALRVPDRIYSIQVDPDQFDMTKPDQAALRNAIESIPTSWTMDTEAFRAVQDAARRLLYLHPCFVRLVLDRSDTSPEELAHGTPLGDPAACNYATGSTTAPR
jgi:hypothetical protein